MECPYCEAKYSLSDLFDESDDVRKERIRLEAEKEIELKRLEYEMEQKKEISLQNEINSFKKSKFSKVLIGFSIFSALCCAVSFSDEYIISGIVAVIMTGMFLTTWLMGMKIIPEKKKGLRTIIAILSFVVFIIYFSLYGEGF
jgi:hypothetical protein